MHCYIKYGENIILPPATSPINNEDVVQVEHSNQSVNIFTESGVDVTRIQKVNKVLIVNPDCYMQLLLDFICTELGLDPNMNIDLCDPMGQMIDVKSIKPNESALKLMKPKETYIIIFYEQDENKKYTKLEPYLHRCTKQDSDFFLRVLSNLSASKRISKQRISRKSEHKSISRGSIKNGSIISEKKGFNRRSSSKKGSIMN